MTAGTVLVTGATGRVGGQVLAQLTARGVPVRAMTRDPARAAFPDGVDVVAGGPGDAAAVAAALDGVEAVFLVLVGDVVEQVRGFAEGVAAAAGGGPRRVVLLSSSSVLHPVAHRIGDEHREAERVISTIAPETTFLRPGPFHSNSFWWAGSIRSTGSVRCLVGNRAGAPIDPADVAEIGVRALTESGHAGAAYELTGPHLLTSGDQTRIIGAAVGRVIGFETATHDEAVAAFTAAGSEPDVAAGNLTALRSRQVPWGRATDTATTLLGRAPRSFRAWVADHAAVFS